MTNGSDIYDVAIIGGASAGMTAAIYSARKKLKTLIITKEFNGQDKLTEGIENYPGFLSISGKDLDIKLLEQIKKLGVDIKEGVDVTGIKKEEDFFVIENSGDICRAETVIIASGKEPRRLNVPGAEEFEGKGIVFCSICDAPLFTGKDVVVVGAGNAGLESAMDLTKYANKIYVLARNGVRGDEVTQEKLKATGKVEFITNTETKEIKGSVFVEKLIYIDKNSGDEKELNVGGVFINIGQVPSTDFLEGFLELNDYKQVKIDHKTNETSVHGVFAAGDVTDIIYNQRIIASGEGAKAALSAHAYINSK